MNINNKGEHTSDMSEWIALYIDDMLEKDEKAELEEHLSTCISCSELMADLLETKNAFANLKPIALPETFGPKLRNALNYEKSKNNHKPASWKRLGAVAAVFMIGVFSYNIYNALFLNPDNLGGQTGLMKSASVDQQLSEAARLEDSAAGSDGASAAYMVNGDLKIYEDLIKIKLVDYTYEILSVSAEPAEFKVLIKNGINGKLINKEYIIQYGNGTISSIDNWLNIRYK